MILEIIKYSTSNGFWMFIGCWILIAIPFKFAFLIWNRFMRQLNIKRQGWPPSHLDADGDFLKVEE